MPLGPAKRLLDLLGGLVGGAVVEIEVLPERISGQGREADSGAVLMVGGSLGGQPVFLDGGALLGAFLSRSVVL